MKQIIVVLIALVLSFLLETSLVLSKRINLLSTKPNDIDNYWQSFKLTHNRTIRNKTLETLKRNIFEKNIKKINELNEKFNNGTISYSSGINKFSDMTSEEFLQYVNKGLVNLTINPIEINISISDDDKYKKILKFKPSLKVLPESVDWRTKGAVNPVQNQGGCGSCWSFSALSALEGQFFRVNKKLVKFSEQHLVDCVYKRDGCDGGLMDDAYDYIITNKGVALQSGYPYTSGSTSIWSATCKYNSAARGAQLTGYTFVSNGRPDEDAMVKALAEVGPLSAALYVTNNFQFYQSGIFNDPLCNNLPLNYINHAINLVGYGTENGQDYYILRNSWDTDWGDNGYMKIARNKNMCNIGSYVLYPNVQSNTPTTTKPPTTTPTTTTAPTTNPKTTANPSYLDLSFKNLQQIDANTFRNYSGTQVKRLNLNGNKLKVIKPNTFAKFKNLETLYMTNNQLSKLESGWANGLTNLHSLFLSSNQLNSLENDTFIGLPNLSILNLVNNGFRFRNRLNAPFSVLTQLSVLDLSNNKLDNTIQSYSFKNLNMMSLLTLRDSNITRFSIDAFRRPFCSPNLSRTIIYIANNPITATNTTLLKNTKCYSFNTVD